MGINSSSLIYLLPVLLVTFFVVVRDPAIRIAGSKKSFYILFFIAMSFIFVFAAMRGNGKGDYFAYLRRGADIKSWKSIFNNYIAMDVGYCVLAWIVNIFNWPAQMVIALMNLISLSCIYLTIKRYSEIPVLSLLVFLPFFFQYDMHAARTAVAISVFTLAIPFIIERKFIKFCIVLIIACMFHAEAVIGLFAYFLPEIKFRKTAGVIILVTGMSGTVLNVYDRFVLYTLKVLHLSKYYNKFYGYMTDAEYGYAARLYDPRLWIVIILFLVFRRNMAGETKAENRYRLFLSNACCLTAVLMIFFSAHTFIAYRLSAFYNIFTILLVPQLLKDAEKSPYAFIGPGNRRQIYFCVVCAYFLLACSYALRMNVPYKLFELVYW